VGRRVGWRHAWEIIGVRLVAEDVLEHTVLEFLIGVGVDAGGLSHAFRGETLGCWLDNFDNIASQWSHIALILLCLNALFENLSSIAVELLEPEGIDIVLAHRIPL